MKKTLMITDVTRMGHGNCCIAGICPEEGNRLYRLSAPRYISQAEARNCKIRPGVVFVGTFNRDLAASEPHVEDCCWHIEENRGLGNLNVLRHYLENSCVSDLDSGLGVFEKGTNVSGYVGRGRSIVSVVPEYASLSVRSPFDGGDKETLKMDMWVDGRPFEFLMVNDFRFYNEDGTINMARVNLAQEFLRRWHQGEIDLIVRVGLTRPWKDKFWLQIDGLHFFKHGTGEYCDLSAAVYSGFQKVA